MNRQLRDIFIRNIGANGRVISMSKSMYRSEHPKNMVVFNACVVIRKDGSEPENVWWGDLDVTLDESSLNDIAKEIGCTLYVLREMDGSETPVDINKSVFSTDGVSVKIDDKWYDRVDGLIHTR